MTTRRIDTHLLTCDAPDRHHRAGPRLPVPRRIRHRSHAAARRAWAQLPPGDRTRAQTRGVCSDPPLGELRDGGRSTEAPRAGRRLRPISECFVSSADHSVTGRCRHSVLAPRRRVPICRSPVRPSDADAAVGQSGLSLWDVEHGASPVAGLVETMYVPSSRRTRLPVGLRGTPDLLAVFRDVVAVSRTVTRAVTLQERQPTLASVSGIYQRFRGQWQTSTIQRRT